MKLAIITSGFLPVPATKGGAVENLIVNFIKENENNQESPINITVFSEYDDKAQKEAKNYFKTKIKFIKTPKFIQVTDKIIFLFAKNVLKKENSQSYRFILKRLYYLNRVSKDLKANNYDKVLLENHPTQYLALKWKKNYIKYQNNYYYHCHNEFPGQYGCEKIIKNTRKFICVSNYISKTLQQYLRMDSNKFVVLKNGINQEQFKQKPSKQRLEELKEKYNIEKNATILLFTGRIVPEKGVLELLEALKDVKEKYKLLIVGAPLNDINTKTKYELAVEEKVNKMEGKVVFTGYVNYEKIYELYHLADIAVLPSIWDDPAPLTIIESLTCELPIITTDSGGIPEYARNGSAIIIKRDWKLQKNISQNISELITNRNKINNMKLACKDVSKGLNTTQYYKKFYEFINK